MGKRGDIFLFIIIALAIAPTLSAATSFYVPKGENYSISFNCKIDGAICTGSSLCNISINYPNSSSLIENQPANNTGNAIYQFNLTGNQTGTVGEHKMNLVCFDGSVNGSQSVIYEVNPSGIRNTQQRTDTITRSIYFMFGIGILLFIAFLFTTQSIPTKWTFFGVSIMFFLIAINLLFTSMQDEIVNSRLETFFSSFTVISWFFFWFVAGLLIIMWALTFIQTYIFKKNMDNARRYGLA